MPTHFSRSGFARLAVIGAVFAGACLGSLEASAQSSNNGNTDTAMPNGPVRLRQTSADSSAALTPAATPTAPPPATEAQSASVSAKRSEFERFVGLQRFGADLVNELASGATDYSPVVPPEYVIQSGDEIQLTMWGSLDADLRLMVDRSGRINIARVGPVAVAGVRFADLRDVISKRVAVVFKNFDLSASVGRLRGVRVYVTGFVQRPGAYSVAGLSTVLNAVMRAGGPATAGSFRSIELRREGKAVGTFDLYDLLLKGDRSGDRLVQPDDVILVAPAGAEVALRGSVNRQAIFELKPGETLRDVLRMAGGFTAVADRSRLSLERLDNRNDQRIVQITLPAGEAMPLQGGDVLRVISAVEASLSVQRQNKRIRVEGEVANPGEFLLPPESTLADAVKAAGGLSPSAFVFGTTFTRSSVRASQQENYERALRDLETDLVRSTTSQRVATQDEAASAQARAAANARLLDRLRALKPSGRVVLQVSPDANDLPGLLLEDGDSIVVPPQPSAVGVFGSVFNTGSYLYQNARTLGEYVRLAGGPTKGADEGSLFVVRANGQVVSSRQNKTGWFSSDTVTLGLRALPGDSVFIPEEMDKTTAIQVAKDWTLILYQLGLGAAGLKATGALP